MTDTVLSKLVWAKGRGCHYNVVECNDMDEARRIAEVADTLPRMVSISIKDSPPRWYRRNVKERGIYYYGHYRKERGTQKRDYCVLTQKEKENWLNARKES